MQKYKTRCVGFFFRLDEGQIVFSLDRGGFNLLPVDGNCGFDFRPRQAEYIVHVDSFFVQTIVKRKDELKPHGTAGPTRKRCHTNTLFCMYHKFIPKIYNNTKILTQNYIKLHATLPRIEVIFRFQRKISLQAPGTRTYTCIPKRIFVTSCKDAVYTETIKTAMSCLMLLLNQGIRG